MLIEEKKVILATGSDLGNANNVTELDFDELCDISENIAKRLKDYTVVNAAGKPNFHINEDFSITFQTTKGDVMRADMTETAFSRLCSYLGVPPMYVKKCYDNGKHELALANFKAWANDIETNFVFKIFDGVVHGVVTEQYSSFSNNRTMQTLRSVVDLKKYMPIQSVITPESMAIRFITRDPIQIEGDQSPIWSGFMVSNNNMGGGALAINDFSYRQWCTNGMTTRMFDGVALKKAHRGEEMSDGKIALFSRAIQGIEDVREEKIRIMNKSAKTKMDLHEHQFLVERIRRNLRLSEKATDDLQAISAKYGDTEWALINGITELAQRYTLDDRLNMENYAGSMLVSRNR